MASWLARACPISRHWRCCCLQRRCRRGPTSSPTLVAALAATVSPKGARRSSRSASSATRGPSPVLTALGNDRLSDDKDGRIVAVLIAGGTTKLIDAADRRRGRRRQAPTTLDRIRVNNRLRGAIEAALGELTLFSTDRAARLAAARRRAEASLGRARRALLEKALAAEKDPAVRAAMQHSLVGGAAVRAAARRSSSRRSARSAPPPTRRSRTCSTSSRADREPRSRAAQGGRCGARLDRQPAAADRRSSPICSRASASAACCCSPRSASRSPLA